METKLAGRKGDDSERRDMNFLTLLLAINEPGDIQKDYKDRNDKVEKEFTAASSAVWCIQKETVTYFTVYLILANLSGESCVAE